MPIVWTALGFSLGLFRGSTWPVPWTAALLLLAATAGGYLVARAGGLRVGAAAFLIAGLLVGAIRGDPAVLTPPGDLGSYHDEQVELRGLVEGLPELVGPAVRFNVVAEAARRPDGEWVAATGRSVVWADPAIGPLEGRTYPFLGHGDLITVAGALEAPRRIGVFDYAEHLAARGVGSIMGRARVTSIEPASGFDVMRSVHRLRRSLAGSIERHVPEPQAALTQALVLGLRGSLTPETSDDFRSAGMTHLLAVSGLHVGVLLGLALLASCRLLGRRHGWYLAPALLLLWAYIMLAGAPPSAVRAGLMGSAFVLALATGRAAVPLNALALAALVVLAWEPRTLWDRSFQMSFSAMAGVLLIGLPLASVPFERWRVGRRRDPRAMRSARLAWRWVAGASAVSFGAVLGSLPLVTFNFGQIPLFSIPATLVVMPLVPVLLVSGLVTALAGELASVLGTVAGIGPAGAAGLIALVAGSIDALSWAAIDIEVGSAGWVWGAYAGIAGVLAIVFRGRWGGQVATFLVALWRGPAGRARATMVVAAFAMIAAAPWGASATDNGDGLLHVHFLDVGQGDATLIVTPEGRTVLVDGGPDARTTIGLIDEIMPAGHTQVDLAVLTHPHADHLNGFMELVRRGRVKQVLVPPLIDPSSREWWDELHAGDVPLTVGKSGMVLSMDDGTRIEVLHPPDPTLRGTASDVDNNGVVLRVMIDDASVLFTGDVFAEGELVMVDLQNDVAADVLQVGHHGSSTSSAAEFLRAVEPSVAVISSGADNRFGHPSDDVVDRILGHVGPELLFETARGGSVELASDGGRWWVVTERR